MGIEIKYNRQKENLQYARLKSMPALGHLREPANKIHEMAKVLCAENNWALPSARVLGLVAGVFYAARVASNGIDKLELSTVKLAELAHVSVSSCKAALKVLYGLGLIESISRFGKALIDNSMRVLKRTSVRSLTEKGLELFGLIKVFIKRKAKEAEREWQKKKNQSYKNQSNKKKEPEKPSQSFYVPPPIEVVTEEEEQKYFRGIRAAMDFFHRKISEEEMNRICGT